METIVGFVIGYLVGVREGPNGLDRLRTSARSIRESQELRELAAGAVALAAPILKQVVAGGGAAVLRGAYDTVAHRPARAGSS